MDTRHKLAEIFAPLYDQSFVDHSELKDHLLAHYTTGENFINIVKTQKIWMSNPYFMNDYMELNFIFDNVISIIRSDHPRYSFSMFDEKEINKMFIDEMNNYIHHQDQENLIYNFLFCFTTQSKQDDNGRLSFWRAYGSDGDGVALLIDPEKIGVTNGSPLFISKVAYLSEQDAAAKVFSHLSEIKTKIKDIDMKEGNNLLLFCLHVFDFFFTMAFLNKHIGFIEENEWRMIYIRNNDTKNLLVDYISIETINGKIQPKLKLPLAPIAGVTHENMCLDHVVDTIMIGPTSNQPLFFQSLRRFFESNDAGSLTAKLRKSQIPYRQKRS